MTESPLAPQVIRAMGWSNATTGVFLIICGMALLAWTRDADAWWLVAGGAISLALRRPELRIEADALVIRGYFVTRRLPWREVAEVRLPRTIGFKTIQVKTIDGKTRSVDGVGTLWSKRPSQARDFVRAASHHVAGPPAPPPDLFPALRSRRGCVYWGIVVNAAIILIAIVAAAWVAVF